MINLFYIFNLRDQGLLLEFLRKKNVLKRIVYCSGCNNPLKIAKYQRSVDGEAFRCYRTKCSEHKKYVSIQKNSFFEDIKISLWESIVAIYYLFTEKTYVNIKNDYNISKNTIIKLKEKLREKYSNFIINNRQVLGDTNVICQIDKSIFRYKQKYYRGKIS